MKLIIVFMLNCFCVSLFAQPKLHSGIHVIAKSYGDSVVLRWAPMQSWAWFKLNTIGYRIERIDLSDKDNPRREWLTPAALRPYSLERFKALFKADNANAAVAAQCLYGKNFEANLRQGQAGIADRANVTETRWAYTLQSADYDAGVAVAVALRFCDRSVRKGGSYIYRVMPAAAPTQGVIDTGAVMVVMDAARRAGVGAAVPHINQGVATDRLVELHWDRSTPENWSGYFIERSEDGMHFGALNKLPFISSRPDSGRMALLQTQHVYIDSLPQNYKTYTYRIRAINPFAEISGYSNMVTVAGRDLTPPQAVNLLNPKFLGQRRIRLTWSKEVVEKDCKGYYITRSRNMNGPYETLNKTLVVASAHEYIDDSAFAHGRNFYMVVAVDTANNISSSIPAMGLVPDETPPAAPTGLAGRIDRSGLVHLSWNAGKEEDIRGYKVYFANAADHIYSQLTTEPDSLTSFVDSINLKTLTKDIWYKIVAVDHNNNHSDFSAAVKLRKPDVVPPTPPVATHVVVTRNGVEMDWINSSSSDVVRYVVYRQEGGAIRSVVGVFRHDPSSVAFHFKDTTARPNLSYSYTAEAIDEDSLRSPLSVAVAARISAVVERPAITSLRALYDGKARLVRLNWQYAADGDYFFILYRGTAGDALQRLQSLDKGSTQYADLRITAGKRYRYAVQAVFKDGKGNSRLGDGVETLIGPD